jgi:hypothetical protein
MNARRGRALVRSLAWCSRVSSAWAPAAPSRVCVPLVLSPVRYRLVVLARARRSGALALARRGRGADAAAQLFSIGGLTGMLASLAFSSARSSRRAGSNRPSRSGCHAKASILAAARARIPHGALGRCAKSGANVALLSVHPSTGTATFALATAASIGAASLRLAEAAYRHPISPSGVIRRLRGRLSPRRALLSASGVAREEPDRATREFRQAEYVPKGVRPAEGTRAGRRKDDRQGAGRFTAACRRKRHAGGDGPRASTAGGHGSLTDGVRRVSPQRRFEALSKRARLFGFAMPKPKLVFVAAVESDPAVGCAPRRVIAILRSTASTPPVGATFEERKLDRSGWWRERRCLPLR